VVLCFDGMKVCLGGLVVADFKRLLAGHVSILENLQKPVKPRKPPRLPTRHEQCPKPWLSALTTGSPTTRLKPAPPNDHGNEAATTDATTGNRP
jgi:hypothetical protein